MSTETRQQLIYGDGALQKASLTYKNPQSGKNTTIPVQFNPTEYSIQRSLKYESHTGQGEEAHPDDQQASRSGLAMLNVSLILDTSTQMQDYQIPKGLSKYLNDSKELTSICQDISLIMKRNAENHEPSMVTFSWGSMAFYGHVTSLKISYQMFNLNGMPVRAKLDMEISGEDKSILNIIGANPHECPDRTKYRRINQREELWMLADTEYHDPSCWREIARENGILNPRKVDYTRRLKIAAL